jgi:formyl-CoA transferase
MKGALAGVKVVELGTYVAAPALGNMLGILGADVVKVEPLEGDPTRKTTPWSWANYNWNKKSVSLDLKSEAGMAAMRSLLKGADVFVESLSPRAVRELGLGFANVKSLNPRIIYCSIKGFASDSKSSERVGFDTIAQAEGGLMYVAGTGGRPSRVGNPCVDLSAAAFGAVGILCAMLAKPRKAVLVEIPLVDVVVYWNGYWLPYIDANHREPTELGTSHPGFSPYGIFETSDGFVFIGVLTDAIWKKLVARLGLPDLPEYSTTRGRIDGRAEVNRIIQEAVRVRSTSSLLVLLGEDVPCARVSSLMDIHGDPELRARGVVREVKVEGSRASVALPPFLRTIARTGEIGGPRGVGADNDILAPPKSVKRKASRH